MINQLYRMSMIFGMALFLQGCKKECLDDSFCVRTCECQNAQTNTTTSCDLGFQCGDDGTCNPAYDGLTCDQICQSYAVTGKCGSRYCSTSDECVREVNCDISDGSGQYLRTDTCVNQFVCDTSAKLCEDNFLRNDQAQCEICFEQTTGGCDPSTGCVKQTNCDFCDANNLFLETVNCEQTYTCNATSGTCDAPFFDDERIQCERCAASEPGNIHVCN